MYFDKNIVIEKTFSFLFSKETTALDIAYGTDKNFLYGCAISIASLLLHNNEQPLAFHIFTDRFTPDDEAKFCALAEQYSSNINVYIVNCQWLKKLPSDKNWSYAIYFRFIAADFLFNVTKKFLYLDSDIICKARIDELITLDTRYVIAAVVKDRDQAWWKERANKLETPEIAEGYFNSGVLLVDLTNWHCKDISQKAMSMLKDTQIQRIITYPDQDILNILLKKQVLYLDKKYNTQFSINYELKAPKGHVYPTPITDTTIFIHYIGPTKPWHNWANYPCTVFFNKAKTHSPWKSVSLEKPSTANQFRYSAKHQFKKGKYFIFFINYCKYFLIKLTSVI
ncbi:lipopolysaccharide 1,3-galactosyltransferase [Pectobacterium sp. FL60-S17]|uniref:glycosyltransferase n=1 Tax=Pectobacterium quasiaquaticum TaxID=2774015 RepID=UPI001873B5C2|nr:glycosyltransferase [Pectobacterium quasiaquaticum]MBE5201831.1 lipopolysaccharide 1,3-galactosyltransferase [Pectobacterium quasiaquaticum]MBE5210146.1 lipopolysaccharide 1,3-galactosyltransferase [Pectobacterium quasiaquaticum]MBE5223317.1 lipopolysaccharide 1,3-galactosyltransferase [Pectobacterium quasiaquaticum]